MNIRKETDGKGRCSAKHAGVTGIRSRLLFLGTPRFYAFPRSVLSSLLFSSSQCNRGNPGDPRLSYIMHMYHASASTETRPAYSLGSGLIYTSLCVGSGWTRSPPVHMLLRSWLNHAFFPLCWSGGPVERHNFRGHIFGGDSRTTYG